MPTPAFSSVLPLPAASPSRLSSTCPLRRSATMTSRTRRAENVPGDFYVDTRCIDCDICRWLAPATFSRRGGQSAVHAQPSDDASALQALRAQSACPTASIHTSARHPLAADAARSFPLPAPAAVRGSVVADVFFNGFASEATFGCASWLLLHRGPDRPFAAMFDVPRFSRPLLRAVQRVAAPVGGVRFIVLSHSDDVAGHERWAEALGAQRVIHKADVRTAQRTDECEVQLEDAQFPYAIGHGCRLLHVPGHTRGSIVMLHEGTKSLFAGDHLFYSQRNGVLAGSSTYCFYSWEEQTRSVEALADLDFLHGWPGHGRHFHFSDAEDRRRQIAGAVQYMKSVTSPAPVW